jgi:hypothetical protein
MSHVYPKLTLELVQMYQDQLNGPATPGSPSHPSHRHRARGLLRLPLARLLHPLAVSRPSHNSPRGSRATASAAVAARLWRRRRCSARSAVVRSAATRRLAGDDPPLRVYPCFSPIFVVLRGRPELIGGLETAPQERFGLFCLNHGVSSHVPAADPSISNCVVSITSCRPH